jgi:hypothetical protein
VAVGTRRRQSAAPALSSGAGSPHRRCCSPAAAVSTADLAREGGEGGGGPAAAWAPTASAQGARESRAQQPGLGWPMLGQWTGVGEEKEGERALSQRWCIGRCPRETMHDMYCSLGPQARASTSEPPPPRTPTPNSGNSTDLVSFLLPHNCTLTHPALQPLTERKTENSFSSPTQVHISAQMRQSCEAQGHRFSHGSRKKGEAPGQSV